VSAIELAHGSWRAQHYCSNLFHPPICSSQLPRPCTLKPHRQAGSSHLGHRPAARGFYREVVVVAAPIKGLSGHNAEEALGQGRVWGD
jgi:hypothetical protein